MAAQEALNEILSTLAEEEPSNESETCEWLILPALQALGYPRHKIRSRNSDGAGKFPDYTVFPADGDPWFLEAKSYRESLKAAYVDQVVYSAFSTGRRWCVLTNGQEWRLYDASIQGTTTNRLVVAPSIKQPDDILRLFSALEPDSVATGKLEIFSSRSRLFAILTAEFSDPATDTMKAVLNSLRTKMPAAHVDPAFVLEYLQGAQAEIPGPIGPVAVDQRPIKATSVIPPAPLGSIRRHWIIPVADRPSESATDCVTSLVGSGWWGFSSRKSIQLGDRLCFHASRKGVIATAVALSAVEKGAAPGSYDPDSFAWRIRVGEAALFTEEPLAITPEIRNQLDAFIGKESNGNWSWFVQGTHTISENDFERITST